MMWDKDEAYLLKIIGAKNFGEGLEMLRRYGEEYVDNRTCHLVEDYIDGKTCAVCDECSTIEWDWSGDYPWPYCHGCGRRVVPE